MATGMALGSSQIAGATTPRQVLPLASGVSTSSASFVSVAMGHLGDPNNTFWELFVLPSGSSSWSLRTPPGVADNGGLAVAAPGTGPVTVGFLASQLLQFSPLARSTDGGVTWSAGEIGVPLAVGPNVLADGVLGPTIALVSGTSQTVLSSDDLTTWHPVVTTKALAGSAKACGVMRITAVAVEGDTPVLGVQCSQRGRIEVLVPRTATAAGGSADAWSSGGPTLTGDSSGVATVIRLGAIDEAGTGDFGAMGGLARVRSGRSSSLVAFWQRAPGREWSQSEPFVLHPGWSIGATASGGGSSGTDVTVLLVAGSRRRVVSTAGPGAPWATSPAPPAGTGSVITVGSKLEAFAVADSRLTVWVANPGSGWKPVQRITVPVPYGSSS